MRITVLGKSPAWLDAGGACSGYLIEEQDTALLLECGNGVLGKLRSFRDYVEIDAVVISHLHADHFFDLVPYASALTYAPRQQPVPVDRWPGTDHPARPRLYAPEGAREAFRQVCAGGGMLADHIADAFDVVEYAPDDVLQVGPLNVRFGRVPHYLPTFAVELTSAANGSGRFTFGADSSPSDELVAFAHGADLLMLEATLPRPERGGVRGHLTPAEAGEHGSRAGVGKLVLTHISDELDSVWACAEAERAFGAPVTVAAEGSVYEV